MSCGINRYRNGFGAWLWSLGPHAMQPHPRGRRLSVCVCVPTNHADFGTSEPHAAAPSRSSTLHLRHRSSTTASSKHARSDPPSTVHQLSVTTQRWPMSVARFRECAMCDPHGLPHPALRGSPCKAAAVSELMRRGLVRGPGQHHGSRPTIPVGPVVQRTLSRGPHCNAPSAGNMPGRIGVSRGGACARRWPIGTAL